MPIADVVPIADVFPHMQSMADELRRLAAVEAELKAIKEAEPVAWQSPDDTENVPKLVWLREKESVFLGYHFEQPFREYRDTDGHYVGQQDAESYWARHEDGEPCEPDGWCQLLPPLPTAQAKQALQVAQWQKRHPEQYDGAWVNTNEADAKWWRDYSKGWEVRVLYESPVVKALSPLTPTQRRALIDEAGDKTDGLNQDDFADGIVLAVERHHGIRKD